MVKNSQKHTNLNNDIDKNLQYFAKKLKSLRSKRKFTLEQLALKAGVSPNHISKLEAAKTNPSFQLISKLSEALGVEIKEFFDFDEFRSIEYYKDKFRKILYSADKANLKLLFEIYTKIANI